MSSYGHCSTIVLFTIVNICLNLSAATGEQIKKMYCRILLFNYMRKITTYNNLNRIGERVMLPDMSESKGQNDFTHVRYKETK